MNVKIRPLKEISQEATKLLIRELGIVDTFRFLSQHQPTTGNYTEDRHQWLDSLNMEQITSAIKAKRKSKGKK